MVEPTVCYPVAPAVRCGHGRLHEVSKGANPAEVVDDFLAEPFHLATIAINATLSSTPHRDNRDRNVEPDGDNANMDTQTLRRLMSENGDTQAGLARMLGITPDKMSKTLKGKRQLKLDEANRLRGYYGLQEKEPSVARIPVVGLVSAGTWQANLEQVRDWMPSPDRTLSKNAFAVMIEGDSMDLVAKEGEAIIVDPADLDLLPGRYYVVSNGAGETIFKQYRDNPARLEPCSTNPAHATMYPGRDTFTIVGRVRKKVADL